MGRSKRKVVVATNTFQVGPADCPNSGPLPTLDLETAEKNRFSNINQEQDLALVQFAQALPVKHLSGGSILEQTSTLTLRGPKSSIAVTFRSHHLIMLWLSAK